MKTFRKAILIIHGFAGGTYDQEYLAHELELIDNFDVFTFTLPGHDGDTKRKIIYQDWINKAESEIDFLIKKGYHNIYVIGHSMGGVIASYIASKYQNIKKLVLVAPSFRIFGFETGEFNLDKSLNKTQKIFDQYGTSLVTNRLLKLPINCYGEFMKLIRNYATVPSQISIPTLILWGKNDNIVPEESVNYVYESIKCPHKELITLDNTTHDVFRETKKEEATKLIISFFKGVFLKK